MTRRFHTKLLVLSAYLLMAKPLLAYSANKVWFETLDSGLFRVSVQYTIPELKELRDAHFVASSKKEAEQLYWHLLRGGDFSVGGPPQMRFNPPKREPKPW